MAKEIKKEELENEAAEAAVEPEEEEAVKPKKAKKQKEKWSWKKRGAVIGAVVGGAALAVLGRVLHNHAYAKGVSDTTEYYQANPIRETVYLPAESAESEVTDTTETFEPAVMETEF